MLKLKQEALCVLVVVLAIYTCSADVSVYTDSIQDGFANYAWGTSNAADTTQKHSGTASYSFQPAAYDAGYFYKAASISTTAYTGLTFWIYRSTGSSTNVVFNLITVVGGSASPSASVSILSTTNNNWPVNTWVQGTVHFSSFTAGTYDGFWFQDQSGTAAGSVTWKIYLDDISLLTSTSATTGAATTAATSVKSSTTTTGAATTAKSTTTTGSAATSGTGTTTVSIVIPTATLTQISNFGSNPTNVGIWVYVPTSLPASPAVIVALHYCGGTAQAYYTGTQYATLANTHGFIVIYPNAPDSSQCWDVHSTATLTHNSGGDSLGIVSAVRYIISKYNANTAKIFVTGTSSGAMMTNVLSGAYPDIFAAAAAFSGVPYGCFEGSSFWNSQCADGDLIQTAQQWGDLVRSGYPGYTGARPKMQLWHGTIDTTLYYQNLIEAIKEWTNVLGVSFNYNTTNTPLSGYTKMTFGDGTKLVAYSAVGVGHTVPVRENDVLTWFGIA